MKVNVPKIDISGVFLDCEQIEWSMVSGARSPRASFVVSKQISDELESLNNPVSLHIEAEYSSNPEKVSEKITANFENLYLLEIKNAENPWLRTWQIGDQRIKWETKIVTRYYNIHWGAYEARQLIKSDARFADFTTIQGVRYAPWSLRKPKSNEFALITNDKNFSAVPWTAYSIVLDILKNELDIEPILDGAIDDNGFQPENLIFDGENLTNVLEQMMQAAYIGLYQGPDGKIHLYRLDDENKIKNLVKILDVLEGSEVPIRQNLKRIRPGSIEMYFDQEYEVRFDYIHDSGPIGRTVERDSLPKFTLENVLPLPDSITRNGKTYPKGSWVTIDDAITFWNTDKKEPQPQGRSLTFHAINKYWLGENILEMRFALDPSQVDLLNPIWMERIQSLRQHYRRTFRILPFWMKRIRSISATRAALLDPITGQRHPAPVYQDYCVVPTFRKATKAKNKNAHKAARNIERWSKNIENASPAPAVVNIVNEQLGIFSIDFLQDPLFMTSEIIRSAVDGIPSLSAGSSTRDAFWNKAKLRDTFKLSVILSVVFSIPNDLDGKYVKAFKVHGGNEKISQQVLIRRDTARWKWTDKSKASIINGKIFITGSKLDNDDVINAIAQSEAERIRFSWEDRVIGVFTKVGWDSSWVPFAWIKSVTVRFSINDGINTMFNMSEPPQAKDWSVLVPQYVRNIINRAISKESRGI